MLRPDIYELKIDIGAFDTLRSKVLTPLLEYIVENIPERRISVTQAKEILALTNDVYSEPVDNLFKKSFLGPVLPDREVGNILHEWLCASVAYLKTTGRKRLRNALETEGQPEREAALWGLVFDNVILRKVEMSGKLNSPESLEAYDLVIECMKLWTGSLSAKLHENLVGNNAYDPADYFHCSEEAFSAEFEHNGSLITLTGIPDAILLDPEGDSMEVVEYKFGRQDLFEQQVAQLVLYMEMIKKAKNTNVTGRLLLFRSVEETDEAALEVTAEAPAADNDEITRRVEQAFEKVIGNEAALYHLKAHLKMALRTNPPVMRKNIMLCGPGGLGKSMLARSVSTALDLPSVIVQGSSANTPQKLLELIDNELQNRGLGASENGTESGRTRLLYPPVVVFIDEVHELKRRSDAFLSFLEPNTRKLEAEGVVCDFTDATVLAATTDKGKLPVPFLTRFTIIELVPYTADEVAEIIKPEVEKLAGDGVHVSAEFLKALARISRKNPRTAKNHADDYMTFHLTDTANNPLTVEGLLRRARETFNVDEDGLTQNDIQYLRSLTGGPQGLEALRQRVNVGREEIENIIEPYLLELDSIKKTPSGRELTEKGRMILKRHS